jgi:hypothetical protein
MRIANRALLIVLLTAVPLGALAGPVKSADRAVTVGEFAVMLATARGDAPTFQASKVVEMMVQAGVPLPADPSLPLTERALADVLDFYGVKVTGVANRTVSPSKAEAVLLTMGSALSSTAAARPAPATLDDCLALGNTGQCIRCCRELGGTPNSCARLCSSIHKPSPSEPLP